MTSAVKLSIENKCFFHCKCISTFISKALKKSKVLVGAKINVFFWLKNQIICYLKCFRFGVYSWRRNEIQTVNCKFKHKIKENICKVWYMHIYICYTICKYRLNWILGFMTTSSRTSLPHCLSVGCYTFPEKQCVKRQSSGLQLTAGAHGLLLNPE